MAAAPKEDAEPRHQQQQQRAPNPPQLRNGAVPRRHLLWTGAAAVVSAAATPLARPPPAPAATGASRKGGLSASSGVVIKDPESLLRWALPVNNKGVRRLQSELESISGALKSKKWAQIAASVRDAQSIVNKPERLLADVAAERQDMARSLLLDIQTKLGPLSELVAAKEADKTAALQREIVREVGDLEELMISRFPFEVPREYDALPQLRGRATIEMVLRKGGGENGTQFDIETTLYDRARLTIVMDGYTAPVTAGAVVDLVQRGFYDGLKIVRSDGFVIQSGDPSNGGGGGTAAESTDGFVDPDTKQKRIIPLEVFARGDKEPLYGLTLEDDGRGGVQTVLPFTSFGTMAMAREEFTADSASSQFFWFLFEPDLTPAGRNLLDGRYCVFGYVTDGEFFLRDVKVGDVIESARVVRGAENLRQPKTQGAAPS